MGCMVGWWLECLRIHSGESADPDCSLGADALSPDPRACRIFTN